MTRHHPLRGLGPWLLLASTLSAACVTPPIGQEPGPDERLGNALSGGSDGSYGETQRLGREVRAISLDHPRHVPTLIADAAISVEAGDGERAMSLLDRALAMEPDNVDATVLAVGQAIRNGDARGAQRRLESALRLRPDHPGLYGASASIHFVEGRYPEALDALDRAEALAGEATWRHHYHRALIAEAQGSWETSREHLEACLELAPDFPQAQRRLRAMTGRL